MQSQKVSRTFNSTAQAYGVSVQKPKNYLVHYIFIQNKGNVTKQQEQKINNIYEQSQRTMKEGLIKYKPLGHSLADLDWMLTMIRGNEEIQKGAKGEKESKGDRRDGKLVKLVVDFLNCRQILQNLKKCDRLSEIDEVYLSVKDKVPAAAFTLMLQFKNEICGHDSLDFYITQAHQNVQKWKKNYQITRNSVNLRANEFEKAYMFRIRMFANKNLKPSKYSEYKKKFIEQIKSELNYRKQSNKSNKLTSIQDSLEEAIELMASLRQLQQKSSLNPQYNDQKKQKEEAFIEVMFKLYKQQTIFYEFLNQGIRKIAQKDYYWECLSLPIHFMDKAIYLWYQNPHNRLKFNMEKDEIEVYRGGKAKPEQLKEMYQSMQKNPFYQFFSFLSASTNINEALKFMTHGQKQKQKYNCLFKITIKKPRLQVDKAFQQFFNHGFCFIPNYNDSKQDECLINAMSIGKITKIESLSMAELKKQYKNTSQFKYYENISVISVQFGTFEELFTPNDRHFQHKEIPVMKKQHKLLIEHFIESIKLIKRYESFEFTDAYQLCNQMEKSYQQLKAQFNAIIEEDITNSLADSQINSRFNIVYQKQKLCSRLAQICQKMGKLFEAETFNKLAIQRYKKLQAIDKNRCYQQYNEKLNKMYLFSSRILIQQHKYFEASGIIQKRIQELKQVDNEQDQKRNNVAISKLLLDLGVVNFKHGKLEQAKQTFHASNQKIQQVFEYINYDYLNEETYYLDYFKGLFFDQKVTLSQGTDQFFERKRQQKKDEVTKRYGGQKVILDLKRNVNEYESLVIKVITSNRQHFASNGEYRKIIQLMNSKIEKKMKAKENIKEQKYLKTHKEKLPMKIQLEYSKEIQQKKKINEYERVKQQINKNLIMDQKGTLAQISQQEKEILAQKQRLVSLQLQLWQNPIIFLQKSEDIISEFNDLFIKKQQINIEILRCNNQITRQSLTQYYMSSISTINSYIQQLSKKGYSSSAPKVLRLYNSMIQMKLEIGCQEDATQQIDKVKQFANTNKTQKYYELGVAYLMSAKIEYSNAELDFTIIIKEDHKYKVIVRYQEKKINKSLEQLENAHQEMKRALCHQNQAISEAYKNQPKRIEILLYKIKCFIKKYQLGHLESDLIQVQKLLAEVSPDIHKISSMRQKDQHRATYYEAQGVYYFVSKRYNQSLSSFKEAIMIRDKVGEMNWLNILTYIKIIYLFHCSDKLQPQLNKYYEQIEKALYKYRNYPFYWKIMLAKFVINKDCQNHKKGENLSYLQQGLTFMQKIGFADQYFYLQYQILYDFYKLYYEENKPYLLNKIRMVKNKRENLMNSTQIYQLPNNIETEPNFNVSKCLNTDYQTTNASRQYRQQNINNRRSIQKTIKNSSQQPTSTGLRFTPSLRPSISLVLLDQQRNIMSDNNFQDKRKQTDTNRPDVLHRPVSSFLVGRKNIQKKMNNTASIFYNKPISESKNSQQNASHGKQPIKIDNLHQEVRYIPANCFSHIIRRKSSVNYKQKILQLSGNSMFQSFQNNSSFISTKNQIKTNPLDFPPILSKEIYKKR